MFVKKNRLHLNVSVYTNIYTFTLRYIRLHKHIYVYTNIYTFTLTYIRLHKHMYVYTNIYTFAQTTVRLPEHFVELVGLSCSSGVRIPYGRKTGEARGRGHSPRSWTFVKEKRLHLNMCVYTNIYTFTRTEIRLH